MNRYQNIPITKTVDGKRYYSNSKYPTVPLSVNDVYVITSDGDRLDKLASQYYKDPSLWWVISISNDDLPQDSLYLSPGTQLRIPLNYPDILAAYNALNS
jgi:nucleoid-associated protein YgaU